jgi:hypothetical protein
MKFIIKEWKQNKDNVMDFIYKLLLNSLYGRLEFKMTNFKHTLFQRMFPVLYWVILNI